MAKNHVLAIVLAGGEGKRLMPLTEVRAKPAVPAVPGLRGTCPGPGTYCCPPTRVGASGAKAIVAEVAAGLGSVARGRDLALSAAPNESDRTDQDRQGPR